MDLEIISYLASFHILISILTFGILGLAAVQASLLYLQNELIRRKVTAVLIRALPPIETMEKRLFQIIVWGFIFLSFSLISAWLFVDNWYTGSHFHKILLSCLAWLFFAILLLGRYRAGWRGPTAVRWTLMGVIILMVAYFSSLLI